MEQKSNGALISSIIIILILIIGGIYFWKTSIKGKINTGTPAADTGAVSGADLSGVESDLNSIDVNNLDQGL